MSKVVIIGGGFAGLSAAVYLSRAGHKVKLFESSPKPGGRAYSFTDKLTGDVIDNGQHIMMGCYKETLAFLKLIDSTYISIQDKLKVVFLHRTKGEVSLIAKTAKYPLNLLTGILGFKALSVTERFNVLKLFIELKFSEHNNTSLSVRDWLIMKGQTENSIQALWEIICIGALNSDSKIASAAVFSKILKVIFLSDASSASIVIPASGLSEMYCNHAVNYIKSHGGEVYLSSRVEKIGVQFGKACSVLVNNQQYSDFDFIISSVPYYSVNNMFEHPIFRKDYFVSSSILSVHIWPDENPFKEQFYGLIDSPVHWIFNHNSYITIVISSADKYIPLEKEEILKIVLREINSFFPEFQTGKIRHYRVIKEKRATFIPDHTVLDKRPGPATEIENFYLAGDWTDTGLPATIEGAVISGKIAAGKVISAAAE